MHWLPPPPASTLSAKAGAALALISKGLAVHPAKQCTCDSTCHLDVGSLAFFQLFLLFCLSIVPGSTPWVILKQGQQHLQGWERDHSRHIAVQASNMRKEHLDTHACRCMKYILSMMAGIKHSNAPTLMLSRNLP